MKKFLVISCAIIVCLAFGYYTLQKEINHAVYNVNTPQFIKEDPQAIIEKIENKEEGIYYFGFSSCPWCIEFLPILDEVLNTSHKKAYVVDITAKNFLVGLEVN